MLDTTLHRTDARTTAARTSPEDDGSTALAPTAMAAATAAAWSKGLQAEAAPLTPHAALLKRAH